MSDVPAPVEQPPPTFMVQIVMPGFNLAAIQIQHPQDFHLTLQMLIEAIRAIARHLAQHGNKPAPLVKVEAALPPTNGHNRLKLV